MSKKTENAPFTCTYCSASVPAVTNGSYRNHCPFCLYSLHVDVHPGDSLSDCGGMMKPVGVEYHTKKGYQIIHECMICGSTMKNKIAENTVCPDDFKLIMKLVKQER